MLGTYQKLSLMFVRNFLINELSTIILQNYNFQYHILYDDVSLDLYLGDKHTHENAFFIDTIEFKGFDIHVFVTYTDDKELKDDQATFLTDFNKGKFLKLINNAFKNHKKQFISYLKTNL